ncbi:hypothetical protein NLJ89_g10457 [Agrocybe chaxingu]|uniref:Uncharacterized protein n=1 Tax=Agrocybe chaxingu TaxID=84603 RepID=A0A9W8JQK7_9AGAR|nr:hypothetical protein NLJ89_g10457 [Agrocybe chaxingu]
MTSNPAWGPEGTPHEIILERAYVACDFLTGAGYGGPWQYFLATQDLPVNVMFYTLLFLLTFLADLLILWRCWVIWSATGVTIAYVVIAFPTIMLLASFVLGTLWTIHSSKPGVSLYSAVPIAYGTSYFVVSLGVNIILTILIATRLLLYRRKISAIISPDHGSKYFSLATIFIESAALYSIFAIMFIVTYAIDHPMNQIFLAFASASQINKINLNRVDNHQREIAQRRFPNPLRFLILLLPRIRVGLIHTFRPLLCLLLTPYYFPPKLEKKEEEEEEEEEKFTNDFWSEISGVTSFHSMHMLHAYVRLDGALGPLYPSVDVESLPTKQEAQFELPKIVL